MGGGGPDIDFEQGPQQQAVWRYLKPLLREMKSSALRGKPTWQSRGQWDIPSVESMMPTAGWWEGLDPSIRAGIWEPYLEGAQQGFETFGSRGLAGSPSAGPSGAFGRAMGEYFGKTAGPSAALTGWGMVSPALQTGWQAELEQSRTPWLMREQARAYPWQTMPGLLGGTYSYPIISPQSGMNWGAGFGGAATGGLVGTQLAGWPWGTGAGIMGGFLGSLFG